MSRQFRFYLLPPQIEELISALKTEFGFRVISSRSSTREPMELSSALQKITENGPRKGSIYVNCYLAPPFASSVSTHYAPRVNDWYTVFDGDELIELSGCYHDSKELHIGRFYFHTNYLNNKNDALIPHRQLFIKWGEKLFRAAKRRLEYSRDIDAYTDGVTERWRQQGGQFVAF